MDNQQELFQVHSYDPKSFRASHEYIDEMGLLQVLSICLNGAPDEGVQGNGNVALSGPKGCGKDHLAMESAIIDEAAMFKTQAFQNMNEMDLLGYPQTFGQEVRFVHGILPAACMHGQNNPDTQVYIVIDEVNLASSGVLAVMNPMTDATRSISIPFTGETVKRPENVKIILTMNPWEQAGYAGTNQLNIAMLDRFNIIEVDYLGTRSETKLLMTYNEDYEVCAKWAQFAEKSRSAYKNSEVTNVITTRNLIDYVQYVKVLTERQVIQLALNQFLTDERVRVEKWWGGMEAI